MRSFTLEGGLGTLADRIRRQAGVTVTTGCAAASVERHGAGFAVTLAGGERLTAERVAIATPPRAAARLLAQVAPDAAAAIAGLGEAVVDTMGVVVRADRVRAIPYATFLIPCGDIFHSVVTRDIVADPSWRGFAFHFQPDHPEAERMARITQLLGVARGDLAEVVARRTVLPSPVLGHAAAIARLDAAIAGQRLAVTGNWFAGLSIEDCVQRSRAEWQRIAAEVSAAAAGAPAGSAARPAR
jgi:UDP-galactopyranose mutase